MKRILVSATIVAMAAAFGCSKSNDKAMSDTAAAAPDVTEPAMPVTASDAEMAKVLVLKFHHDN